ncbi:hypothetical protein [Flavobacterium silvaticum]|uniref:Uncharacterized protein n=1 Tax=Flavobacterium silvaticum TaxID=1852020 RepID=A0A972FJ03_9FLAO|nr:hypothetical protein [Flavobacterium silvaticum]NMH26552.1 hypothetical protein [Flavobacterium silvaticum]
MLSFFNSLDYETTTIPELITQSEFIGKVEIVDVQKNRFKIKILDKIKGSLNDEIWVNKFQNWMCASRWTDYSVGQQELIFLNKNNKTEKWYPIGAGNEGEIPTVKDSVFVLSKNYFVQKRGQKQFKIHNQKAYAYPFSYLDTKLGILSYMENQKTYAEFSCDEFRNFKTENLFLQGIVLQITPTNCEEN